MTITTSFQFLKIQIAKIGRVHRLLPCLNIAETANSDKADRISKAFKIKARGKIDQTDS